MLSASFLCQKTVHSFLYPSLGENSHWVIYWVLCLSCNSTPAASFFFNICRQFHKPARSVVLKIIKFSLNPKAGQSTWSPATIFKMQATLESYLTNFHAAGKSLKKPSFNLWLNINSPGHKADRTQRCISMLSWWEKNGRGTLTKLVALPGKITHNLFSATKAYRTYPVVIYPSIVLPTP